MSNSNSNNRLSYARWQHDAAMQAQEQRRSSTKQSGHGSNRHSSKYSRNVGSSAPPRSLVVLFLSP